MVRCVLRSQGRKERKARTLINSTARNQTQRRAPATSNGAAGAAIGEIVPDVQKVLVASPEIDLDASFTMLETVEIAPSRKHVGTTLDRVRRALQVVRRVGTRIEDPATHATIHNRADGLELRLEAFPV